jgi:hypothetical protein
MQVSSIEVENFEIVEVKCRVTVKIGDVKVPTEFVLKPEDFKNSEELCGFNITFFPRGSIADPQLIERLRSSLASEQ